MVGALFEKGGGTKTKEIWQHRDEAFITSSRFDSLYKTEYKANCFEATAFLLCNVLYMRTVLTSSEDFHHKG